MRLSSWISTTIVPTADGSDQHRAGSCRGSPVFVRRIYPRSPPMTHHFTNAKFWSCKSCLKWFLRLRIREREHELVPMCHHAINHSWWMVDDRSHNPIHVFGFCCQVCSEIQRASINGILFFSNTARNCKSQWCAKVVRRSWEWKLMAAKCGSGNPAMDFPSMILGVANQISTIVCYQFMETGVDYIMVVVEQADFTELRTNHHGHLKHNRSLWKSRLLTFHVVRSTRCAPPLFVHVDTLGTSLLPPIFSSCRRFFTPYHHQYTLILPSSSRPRLVFQHRSRQHTFRGQFSTWCHLAFGVEATFSA